MSNGKGDRQRQVDKNTYYSNYESISWTRKCENCLVDLSSSEGENVTIGLFNSVWCESCTKLEFERNER